MAVRVRFAPSPTGHVHIGNIRVAIFNWLFARHTGGEFLLRIEDTDRERSTPDAIAAIFDALEWLGMDHDGEPVYQSGRLDAHLEAAERLLSGGHAYREDKGDSGAGECVVFRMPGDDMTFHDEIKGDLSKAARDVKDFVIVRSNGTPVFHLANVVDDIGMGITHILRGDDHIENTYRHVALFRALGADPPRYAHLPMIINDAGKPYSKRDGDAYVGEFRDKGYSPDALFNYLSLLGWSPGEDREKLDRQEAVALFSLDRVKSSPAKMDLRKLRHLNGQYVAELPLPEFVRAARDEIRAYPWAEGVDEAYFETVCELMQSRTHLVSMVSGWKYFFAEDFEYEEKPTRKFLRKEGVRERLAALRDRLETVDFGDEAIERALREVEAAAGIREGTFNQPVRIAVTGTAAGAGLYETMNLLGKERVAGRLGRAVSDPSLCGEGKTS